MGEFASFLEKILDLKRLRRLGHVLCMPTKRLLQRMLLPEADSGSEISRSGKSVKTLIDEQACVDPTGLLGP